MRIFNKQEFINRILSDKRKKKQKTKLEETIMSGYYSNQNNIKAKYRYKLYKSKKNMCI
jgi:hypothetical protein